MARRRGYISVTVDIADVIDDIDDASLLEEVKERKLSLGRDDFEPMDDLRDAREELLRGRPAEALAILERLLSPKWRNFSACQSAAKLHAKAMI